MLKDAIDEYEMYNDKKLGQYIYNLEEKYNIIDEISYFNELVNFSKNKDIPYHSWFKYREGFSHTLIKELIRRSNMSKDEFVLDPFCGSGTTIVEASINGYSGVGIDINPMSSFISKVKCRSYRNDEVESIINQIAYIEQILPTKELFVNYRDKYREVEKFFSEKNFSQLLIIRETIDEIMDTIGTKLYEFFLCAYISIIEAISDRKRDGNGLKTQESKISDVYGYYTDKTTKMLSDIKNHRISENIISHVEFGSALELSKVVERSEKLLNMSIGAIMYSPPYANSFDYFESYKMEVILADYAKDMKEINIFRQQAVESFIGRNDDRSNSRDFIEMMSKEIEEAIPAKERNTGKKDGRTRKVPKMVKGYFTDMEKVIQQSSKVLTKDQYCYIVVDQSAYLGKIVPTDLFLASIGEEYEFYIENIIICRNAKTSGQQLQKYPYLKDSLRESIVVMKKK